MGEGSDSKEEVVVLQQNTVNQLTHWMKHNLQIKIIGNSRTWAILCVCQTKFMGQASLEISWMIKQGGCKIQHTVHAMTVMIGAIILIIPKMMM